MLLIIKGDRAIAQDSATRHGLLDASFVSERPSDLGPRATFTTLRVDESEWRAVSDWFNQSTPDDLKPGIGFPDGTCLWFRYEEGAR